VSTPQQPIDAKLEPLGADADNLDGLNFHAAIVDELHAHKTAHSGICSRPQPARAGSHSRAAVPSKTSHYGAARCLDRSPALRHDAAYRHP
jgi:hypothetical protein